MKRIHQSALLLTLFSVCLVGCNSKPNRRRNTSQSGAPEGESVIPPGEHWEGYEEHYMNKIDRNGNPVTDYYLETATGEELQKRIHHYLIDQHRTYLHYSQVAQYFAYTDCPEGSNKYENFYTGYLYRDNTVTREHMWCCANSASMWYRSSSKMEWKMDDSPGSPENYWGGGSDIFQLRPCTYEVNSKRQNYKYYVYKSGESFSTVTDQGAPYSLKYNESQKTCEVDDYFKGDVARTLAYMYVHYNSYDNYDVYYSNDYTPTYNPAEAIPESSTHTPYVCSPNKSLKFNLIMNFSENECIKLIKEWNNLDPVSDLEKKRNNMVELGIQGNRNPFIDYPELINRCF